MSLPPEHKTKLVCTIGPASDSPETLEKMIQAGMNVARLNFSHGDLASHETVIQRIRAASIAVGRPVAIMADLPGPKMRIGELQEEPVRLRAGEHFVLTTASTVGNRNRVSASTQLLHSMVTQRRPTRAEATDVANAILDGTDCVMLSEESAMGEHPVEAVAMLARIAEATEPHRSPYRVREALDHVRSPEVASVVDLIALSVQLTLERAPVEAVIVPTVSGATARNIARFRSPVWATAFSPEAATCQALQFSYGVNPVPVPEDLDDWNLFSREWLSTQGINAGLVLLVQGPSQRNPAANHRMEIIDLGQRRLS